MKMREELGNVEIVNRVINGSAPKVIVTDRELAFMAAIASGFPSSLNLR